MIPDGLHIKVLPRLPVDYTIGVVSRKCVACHVAYPDRTQHHPLDLNPGDRFIAVDPTGVEGDKLAVICETRRTPDLVAYLFRPGDSVPWLTNDGGD